MESARERELRSLWIGTGARLATLRPYLAGAARSRITWLGDLDELPRPGSYGGPAESGVLLLDVDELPREDLGIVRRFLARSPQCALVLTGADAAGALARSLLRAPRARWMSWPPDIDDLGQLAGDPAAALAPPRASEGARARGYPAPFPAEPPRGREREPARDARSEADEYSAIEAILCGAGAGADAGLRAVELETAPERAALAPELPDRSPASLGAAPASFGVSPDTLSTPPAAPGDPPRYLRDQVADLADIAQRVELSVQAVRAAGDESAAGDDGAALAEPLEALHADVARLIQFTRTLGYLVAPPAAAGQVFDVVEMLEVFVSSLVSSGPEAPRCLFRGSGPLLVRCDRQHLSLALDACFALAQNCSGRGEIVRVQVRADHMAEISIEFPAGPLAELAIERILEPYGVRREVPAVGPNALAAALNIVAGQGGAAELARAGHARLAWSIRLPRAAQAPPREAERAPERASDRAPERAPDTAPLSRATPNAATLARADDPFA